MSLKISGFQYIHLLSSTVELEIISWNELSPVFSLTHCIPFGEKIENPEEDPMGGLALCDNSSTVWLTNIPCLPAIVCYQRAHHIRQVLHFFVSLLPVI